MRIFAFSDPHLGLDPRVDKPMDLFGSLWDDHAAKIKENWTELGIGDDDYVIVAGDLSWGLTLDEALMDLQYLRELPGKKIFVKGNHDLWWQSLTKIRAAFQDEEGNPPKDMHFLQNDCEIIERENSPKIAICGTRGWICPGADGYTQHDEKIYRREVLRLEASLKSAKAQGAEIIYAALHYPPTNDKQQASELTELFTEYAVKTVVYGHLHNPEVWPKGLKGIFNSVEYKLVSADYLKMKPELIYEI